MKVYNISVNGKEYEVEVREKKSGSATTSPKVAVEREPAKLESATKHEPAKLDSVKSPITADGLTIQAPMPGKILSVNVKEGESVELNQVLCYLEAMKMENEITSPGVGTVEKIYIQENDHVDTGDLLFTIT